MVFFTLAHHMVLRTSVPHFSTHDAIILLLRTLPKTVRASLRVEH